MDERLIRWVMSRTAGLGAVWVVASATFGRLDVTLSVALGVALGVMNLWALTRIVRGLFLRTSQRGKSGAGAVLVLKFLAFAAVLYVIMRTVAVHPLALLVGLSAVVVTIVLGSVLGPPPSAEDSENADAAVAVGLEENRG